MQRYRDAVCDPLCLLIGVAAWSWAGLAACSEDVDTETCFRDLDRDGYSGSETRSCWRAPETVPGDCDDDDGERYPGAEERCDGVDNDCDGEVDEGAAPRRFVDRDEDGWGSGDPVFICGADQGYSAVGGDCDDNDNRRHPGASEFCGGEDEDCDGTVDEDVVYALFVDLDGDGYGQEPSCDITRDDVVELDGDCDDLDAQTNPEAVDVCDGLDNDCDGGVDERALPETLPYSFTQWLDVDSDGRDELVFQPTGELGRLGLRSFDPLDPWTTELPRLPRDLRTAQAVLGPGPTADPHLHVADPGSQTVFRLDDSRWTRAWEQPIRGFARRVAFGDFLDGAPAVAFGVTSSSWGLPSGPGSVLVHSLEDGSLPVFALPDARAETAFGGQLVSADFDQDGLDDLVVWDSELGQGHVYFGPLTEAAGEGNLVITTQGRSYMHDPDTVSVADVDDDGVLELVIVAGGRTEAGTRGALYVSDVAELPHGQTELVPAVFSASGSLISAGPEPRSDAWIYVVCTPDCTEGGRIDVFRGPRPEAGLDDPFGGVPLASYSSDYLFVQADVGGDADGDGEADILVYDSPFYTSPRALLSRERCPE